MPVHIITDNLSHYEYNADIVVIALSFTMAALLFMTRKRKEVKLKILYSILLEFFVASFSDIIYQAELYKSSPSVMKIYIFRVLHYILLALALQIYIFYLYDPLWIPRKDKKHYIILSSIGIFAAFANDICGTVFKYGFHIHETGEVHVGINSYTVMCAVFCITVFYLLFKYRGRLLSQVFWSLISTNAIAIWILATQLRHQNLSYTTFAYFMPILGLIFMFHSNPFDVESGAMSETYFIDELGECIEHNENMYMVFCMIRGFSEYMKNSQEFKQEYYNFLRVNVKKGILYSLPNGRLVLMMKNSKDDSIKNAVDKMMRDFQLSYQKFQLDYKIILLETTPDINNVRDYIRLLEDTSASINVNEIYRITSADIRKFYDSSYILSQLEDIARKKDLGDARVVVYCQPIYNIATGRYDTAETLMRLNLEKTGIVYPDRFIPLAEKHNVIHSLSMIILDKACAAVRDFLEEGYEIQRVSVNFSTADLRYDSFSKEVKNIIDRNNIPYSNIAIEITESRSDADFNIMKQKVEQLKQLGIKFYLDDFGTGYSNFERIMEIPFDIIKFDRSMLMAITKSESTGFMVSTFANMFHNLNYTLLFEGVEDEKDQQNCIRMNASYLQGYKFSRPIPIEQLRSFLQHSQHKLPSENESAVS